MQADSKKKSKSVRLRNHAANTTKLLLVILLLSQIGGVFADTTDHKNFKILTAAVPKSFPPYYQLDENGRPIGFGIDSMNAVAKIAGFRVYYRVVSDWQHIFSAARAGEIDIIPNVGMSADRAEYLDFSVPTHTFHISLFIRHDTRKVKGLSDLKGRKVGAVRANVGYQYISHRSDVTTQPFMSFEQAFFALLAGQIDGLVYPEDVAWKILTETHHEHTVVVAGKPLAEVKRVIGVRKGEFELTQSINTAVTTLLKSGQYREIYDKWFTKAPAFWTLQRLLWLSAAVGVLTTIVIVVWRYYSLLAYKTRLHRTVEQRTQELKQRIIEHEHTSKELKVREKQLAFHFEHTPLAAITWDRKFCCIEWNAAAEHIFGFTKDEAIGQHALDLVVPKELHAHIDEIFQALLNQQGGGHSVNENTTKNGHTILCEWFNTSLRDENGLPYAVTSLAQDITERKQAELDLLSARDEAEKANQSKSEFLANMSHELRTPLHGILSYAQFGTIKLDQVPKSKLGKYFTQISASGYRLKVLLDDLLDLSKLEAGKMLMDFSLVDIRDVIESCVAEQEALLAKQQLHLELNLDSTLLQIDCDKNRIGQVVMNILSNAIKFSPHGGSIFITAGLDTLSLEDGTRVDAVHFSLADQGPGIPIGEEQSIFHKFTQSSNTKLNNGGTGLGLAITKQLIHAHRGIVWCENNPGGGATFHFKLPVNRLSDSPLGLERDKVA